FSQFKPKSPDVKLHPWRVSMQISVFYFAATGIDADSTFVVDHFWKAVGQNGFGSLGGFKLVLPQVANAEVLAGNNENQQCNDSCWKDFTHARKVAFAIHAVDDSPVHRVPRAPMSATATSNDNGNYTMCIAGFK